MRLILLILFLFFSRSLFSEQRHISKDYNSFTISISRFDYNSYSQVKRTSKMGYGFPKFEGSSISLAFDRTLKVPLINRVFSNFNIEMIPYVSLESNNGLNSNYILKNNKSYYSYSSLSMYRSYNFNVFNAATMFLGYDMSVNYYNRKLVYSEDYFLNYRELLVSL